jgi:hypothetical protein
MKSPSAFKEHSRTDIIQNNDGIASEGWTGERIDQSQAELLLGLKAASMEFRQRFIAIAIGNMIE